MDLASPAVSGTSVYANGLIIDVLTALLCIIIKVFAIPCLL